MKTGQKPNTLTIILTLCGTLVLLAGVGGWVYIQHETLAQKDQQFQQQQKFESDKLKQQRQDHITDSINCTFRGNCR